MSSITQKQQHVTLENRIISLTFTGGSTGTAESRGLGNELDIWVQAQEGFN